MRQNSLIFLFFVLLFKHGFAFNHSNLPYDEVISLGPTCQVAYQLNLHNLRKQAYPFDWIDTPLEGLIQFLVHQGYNFLTRDALIPVMYLGITPAILDTNYGITLVHDFKHPQGEFLKELDAIKDKYMRRTQRFFALLQSHSRILFIRKDIDYYQAIFLDNILHTSYPHLSYTLLVLGSTDSYKVDWGLERIKNMYLPEQIPFDWRGDHQAWATILNSFPLVRFNPSVPIEF